MRLLLSLSAKATLAMATSADNRKHPGEGTVFLKMSMLADSKEQHQTTLGVPPGDTQGIGPPQLRT
jgi:hypothetical protein